MEYVGVGSFHRHMSRPAEWLKRYGLLFDRFAITDLSICFDQQKHSGYGKAATIRDLEWLMDVGIIADAPFVVKDSQGLAEAEASAIAAARLQLDACHSEAQALLADYDQEREADIGWEYSAVPDRLVPVLTKRCVAALMFRRFLPVKLH